MATYQKVVKSPRPACPLGHPGRIILRGRAMRADGVFAYPRFGCVPSDGSKPHKFSLSRRQPGAANPHGLVCDHCEQDYGRTSGARSVCHYTQTINEIAATLTAVGTGSSLRVASRDTRYAARSRTDASSRDTMWFSSSETK